MDFEIDDFIVYNPNSENLAPALERKYNWGHVKGKQGNYLLILFDESFMVHHILDNAISHHPSTDKYTKQEFRKCFPEFKAALECREARQLMLQKTPLSVRLPGPAHLIQDFITNFKRSKTNLCNLTRQ